MRTGVPLSVLCSKAFVLAFVCALCLLSALSLQPAPIAHADALNCTADSSAAKNPVEVCVWLNHRKLHDFNGACSTYPNTDTSNTDNTEPKCAVLRYIDKGSYRAECQTQGGTVTDLGYTNNWWTRLEDPSKVILGWISNIYIKGHDNKATNVPECNFGVTVPLKSTPKSVQKAVWHDAKIYPCAYPKSFNTPGCDHNENIKKGIYDVFCQIHAGSYSEPVNYSSNDQVSNNWWSLLKTKDNKLQWVSNLDIKGPAVFDDVDKGVDACKANTSGFVDVNVDGHP